MAERSSHYDVVIIGAGVAGLTGAIAAAKAGLSAVVLEKSDLIGGCSSWAYSAIWVPGSDQAIAAGIVDDHDAATYVNYLGGGENDPGRTHSLLENAPAVLRLLDNVGVSLRLLPGVGDILAGKAPGAATAGRTLEPFPVPGSLLGEWRNLLRTPTGDAWRLPISVLATLPPSDIPAAIGNAIADDQLGQGPALVAQLMRAVRDLGIRVELGFDVSRILKLGAQVCGVELKDGTVIEAHKAVLLATGSYLSNDALVAQLDSLPGYRSIMPEGSDGNGLKLAADAGAAIGMTRNNLGINVGYDNPATPGAPLHPASVWELPRAHVILVNDQGKRFGNEATFQEYAPAFRAYDAKQRKLANLPCWLIFDSTYVDKWGFAGSEPGSVPSWAENATDIAALAEKMGIDAAGLTATVTQFNHFAEIGVDDDFGRAPGWDMQRGAGDGPNPSLGVIAKAPFYAVKLSPTLQVGGSGIKTDAQARILDWTGRPIPGLYAAGDVALHDDFGVGYQGGLSFASCMTFACLAIADFGGDYLDRYRD